MKNLIKIQNELKVPKGNFNAFGKYKYRSAEDILEAIKPILLANDCYLTLTDEIVEIGGKLFLKATASIKDDKDSISINGFAEMSEHKGMSAEQCTGTASSYARKYALNGLFLIDETESEADNVTEKEGIEKAIKDKIENAKSLEELTQIYNTYNSKTKDQKEFIKLMASKKEKLKNENS
jgi:hypothetical protein